MADREYRLMHRKDGSYVLQIKSEKQVVDYHTNGMKTIVHWIDVETKEER